MAYIKKKVASYKWPVNVTVPSNGTYDTHTFTAIYKVLKKSEIQALEEDDLKFIKSVVIGWEEMEDEEGNEFAFNKTNLEEMAEDIRWSVSVIKTYYESFNEAPEKN